MPAASSSYRSQGVNAAALEGSSGELKVVSAPKSCPVGSPCLSPRTIFKPLTRRRILRTGRLSPALEHSLEMFDPDVVIAIQAFRTRSTKTNVNSLVSLNLS